MSKNYQNAVPDSSNDQWLATHFINPNPSPKEIAEHKQWIIEHNKIVANNLKRGMQPNNNSRKQWLATHYINPNPTPNEIADRKQWIAAHNQLVARNLGYNNDQSANSFRNRFGNSINCQSNNSCIYPLLCN